MRFAGTVTSITERSWERADYFERIEPRFDTLRSEVDRLLQINQAAMLRKSADAQRVTGRSILLTVMLSAALVVAGLGFAVRLSAQIDRDADRLKSEFVGTASHELRTPLTTLQMGIDLLDEQLSPHATARQREILAMCREDAARLERLVTDLLDLSKIESGRMKPALVARRRRDPGEGRRSNPAVLESKQAASSSR